MDQEQEQHSLIEQWLAHLQKQGRSQRTIKAYRRAWQQLAQWSKATYGESFEPTTLIRRDIRDWKSHQQSVEKAAPRTINLRLAAASAFYQWAVTEDLVDRVPTDNVKRVPLPQRQPQSLTYQELRRLLRAVHKGCRPRDIAIVELLAGTGIRVGELLHLHVDDVVLRERSGWLTVREGKHGSYREIPLTRDVRAALAAYLQAHPYAQADGDNGQQNNVHLWMGKHGALAHRSTIHRIINKYTRLAGLDTIGPHILRHTFATLYLRANPDDLRGLAALLGHSDLNTVMIYTEPTLTDLTTRMEKMERHQG